MILSWQMLFKTGFVVYWKINQADIAQKLCENRANPKMHCNGKCYLMKQLKKIEEPKSDDKNLPNSISKLKTIDYFIVTNYDFKLKEFDFLKSHRLVSLHHSFLLSKGYLKSLYRPPEFI